MSPTACLEPLFRLQGFAYRDNYPCKVIPVAFRFNVMFSGIVDMGKIRKAVTVFDLPLRLGVPQYVEYEPPPKEWCTPRWCPNEGLLIAEGCRKGVCIKYKVVVKTQDGKRWMVGRRGRDEDKGGCLRPQVAAALLELATKYDVAVWYEKVETGNLLRPFVVRCGVIVNGVRLDQPYCRTVDECISFILEDYRQEERRLREPPPPDPVEELLQEWPELGAFGREWIERFAVLRDRLVEIANALRRFPWMMEVIRTMNEKPQPYAIFVLMAKDGSDAYLSFDWQKTYSMRGGAVREVRLELERIRYEEYDGKMREVYRPRGLLAFAAAAKEYVRVL